KKIGVKCEARHLRPSTRELQWAVGGFPRLLEAIGLGAAYPNLAAARDGAWLEPATDEVAPFLAALPEPQPLGGGSVEVPLAELPRVVTMLSLIDVSSQLALRLTGGKPDAFRRDELHLTVADGELRAAFPLNELKMREFAPILAALAPALGDGQRLELLSR